MDKDKRKNRLYVYLSDGEVEAVKEAAEKAALDRAVWARMTLLKEAREITQ